MYLRLGVCFGVGLCLLPPRHKVDRISRGEGPTEGVQLLEMVVPKVLIANRGESEWSNVVARDRCLKPSTPLVAIRICRSATELGWHTVALYTEKDASHAYYADEAIPLDSPARYMDPDHIADIAHR